MALAYKINIFERSKPIIITESRKFAINACAWAYIADYYLESVKIQNEKGCIKSRAILKIGDKSGEVTCLLEGGDVGVIFGQSTEEWREIEKIGIREDLFYRYFKNGVNATASIQQKLFYNFCLTNQRNDIFFAAFRRVKNYRRGEQEKPFLLVTNVMSPGDDLLDLYFEK